ncbi:MAG: LCP family protein [Coriobacteriia bacterium]|nr:LCP family protein [Coriobacteriia bacterium]
MGKRSKKSTKRGFGKERMRYEDSVGSGLAGGRRSRGVVQDPMSSRVHQEARNAEIPNTGLSVAKSLDQAPATLLAERDRRYRRNKRRALITLSVIGSLILGLATAGALYYMSLHNRMVVRNQALNIPAIDTPPPAPGEPFNLVIFGSDSRNPDEPARTDTIILARIDPSEQKIWMVSIPRDTRVELPDRGAQKINAAYVYGGSNMAIEAVEELSGQEVDYFITVNFWGFEDIIESMGGIKVDVPTAINCRKSDFTPDKRASRIAPGPQILDGAHALTFVRYRGYSDGDIGRTGAQQLFLRALIEQMTDVPPTRLPGIASSLADNITTSFTPFQLLQLSREMRGVSPDDFYATTLPGEWRSPFVWTNEAEAEVVWSRFGVSDFNADSEDGEEEVVEIAPSDVTMTVRNGTTRVGIGREAAAIMRARGFIVDEVGNTANQAVYDENLVVYRDNRDAANLALRFMPEASRIVQSRGMFRFDSDILVILGTEWDISDVPVADVTSE